MSVMQKARILLVEDNECDIELFRLSMTKLKVDFDLDVVTDGEQALDYLYRRNGYQEVPRPDLVVLDINLPKISGLEVLKIIKQDPYLKLFPVVILTSSNERQDILKSYENYANCFLHKPLDLKDFSELLKLFDSFWLTLCVLPPVHHN